MRGLPTDLEMIILVMLLGGKEMYGLQMCSDDDRLGVNSIYVILTRMVARGFVTARYETDKEKKERGPKRRLYKISDFGKAMYDARLAAQRSIARSRVTRPAGAI